MNSTFFKKNRTDSEIPFFLGLLMGLAAVSTLALSTVLSPESITSRMKIPSRITHHGNKGNV